MSTTIFFQNTDFSEFEIRIFSDEGHNLIMLLCGLNSFGGRSEKKNVGGNRDFRGFMNSFFYFWIWYLLLLQNWARTQDCFF